MTRVPPTNSSLVRTLFNKDTSVATAVSVLRWVGLSALSDPESKALFRRAAACLQAWLERASQSDEASLRQILLVDPIGLAHAVSLGEAGQCSTLVGSYIKYLQECKRLTLEPTRRDKRAVVQKMWECLLPEVALSTGIPQPIAGEQPDLEDFNCNSVARFALFHSSFGSRKVQIQHSLLKTVSRASLLMSMRRRNISEAGLLLMAHVILFPDDDVDHVLQWLMRIRRSDGLFGSWDLFASTDAAANLSASVNVAWALDILGRKRALLVDAPTVNAGTFDAAIPSFSRARLYEVERQVQTRIETWLDKFFTAKFRDQKEYGDKIKPLVELVLALWVQQRSAITPESRTWARVIAAQLADLLDDEGLVEGIRIFTTSTLAALMFPMLEELVDRKSKFRQELQCIVDDPFSRGQERIPMRQMDYYFLRWLFGADRSSDAKSIQAELARTLVAACANPAYFSNDSLYDITHAVFYATKFGTEEFNADVQSVRWCQKWVPELCLSMLLEQDYDLGAELLINWVQLSLPVDDAFWLALGMIVSAVKSDGSVPGPGRLAEYDSLTPFERDYHTTLICLIAFTVAAKHAY